MAIMDRLIKIAGKVSADNLNIPSGDQFVGNPETHGIDTPRGGGFSIMQDLQRDLHKEMKHESDVDANPRMSAIAKTLSEEVEKEKDSETGMKFGEKTKQAFDELPGTDPIAEPVEVDPIDVAMQFTASVAKELLKFRRTHGFATVRQNYKGTGRQRAVRQLWIRLGNGGGVDVWLEKDHFTVGGVTLIKVPGKFPYGVKAPVEVAKEIAEILKKLSEMPLTASDHSNLKSRRAMYWGGPDRIYRLTKEEQEKGSAVCPKCKREMNREPFTKSEKLYTCQECGFKVPSSKTTTTKITIDVEPNGDVDVDVTTAKGKKTRRGSMEMILV